MSSKDIDKAIGAIMVTVVLLTVVIGLYTLFLINTTNFETLIGG